MKLFGSLCLAVVLSAVDVGVASAETISIVIASNATPRVQFGAEKLTQALREVGAEVQIDRVGRNPGRKIYLNQPSIPFLGREGFLLTNHRGNEFRVDSARRNSFVATRDEVTVAGGNDSGILYGCLELAKRIRAERGLPVITDFSDKPAMTLRGTCVGMQKTTILPGRKVYEYPYTPELFLWFYDKALWLEYLDFLAANRMNTLYLWNGHPFASLVRLPDYPDAIEVPPDVFEKNVEMFRWLTTECDRRGIWLVQMFYNIFLPKPLAEKHGIPTQLAAPTPRSHAAAHTRIASRRRSAARRCSPSPRFISRFWAWGSEDGVPCTLRLTAVAGRTLRQSAVAARILQ